jgi:hypothetical protein
MPRRKDYIGTERITKDDAMIDRIERGDTKRDGDRSIPTAIERENRFGKAMSETIVPPEKTRNARPGIDYVQAPRDAWMKSKDKKTVRKIAAQYLAKGGHPDLSKKQLEEMVQTGKGI